MNLNERAKQIHELNAKWWVDLNTGAPLERNDQELAMLVVSELAEAMEGERKNLQDDKLPHRKMAEVEMADAVIRMLDLAAGFNIEIEDFTTQLQANLDGEKAPENKGEFLFNIVTAVCDHGLPPPVKVRLIIWLCEKYCRTFGYDLWGAVDEKLEYNRTREDHTAEARKAANGKKW